MLRVQRRQRYNLELCYLVLARLSQPKLSPIKDMAMAVQTTTITTTAVADNDDLVTVVMSNYRGMKWLEQAIASVMAQTHHNLELIVVDDASCDESVAIVRAAMMLDARTQLVECPTNLGPAGARNLALEIAKGEWVAIVDSDDLMHPNRLARLVDTARHLGCDVVADDMIFFGDIPGLGGCTLLQSLALTAPREVSLVEFMRSDNRGSGLPAYGYLKPLIRRKALGGLRYDPALRVGEDFDFYARLLMVGVRFSVIPDAMYLYRRHSASLSHRLSTEVLVPLLAAHLALEKSIASTDPDMLAATRHRRDAVTWALHYSQLVTALKQRDLAGIWWLLSRHPRLVKPLWQSLRERRQRDQVATSIAARTPLELVLIPLGATLPRAVHDRVTAGARWITVPPQTPPGSALQAPLAPLAAELSGLFSQHILTVLAVGPEGCHALGMLPPVAQVAFWPEPKP